LLGDDLGRRERPVGAAFDPVWGWAVGCLRHRPRSERPPSLYRVGHHDAPLAQLVDDLSMS